MRASFSTHRIADMRISSMAATPDRWLHLALLASLATIAASRGASMARAQAPASSPIGIFRGQDGVGRPSSIGPGSARYDASSQRYSVTGGGANMWAAADHFHYVWIKVSGDAALEATVRFVAS